MIPTSTPLAALLAREERLITRVQDASGTMEDKHAQLERDGVYAEYRNIHRAYGALVTHPKNGMEALKRALFLGWYDVSEPACFTGVFDLPAEVNRSVLERTEALLAEGGLDLELEWMLPWYHSLTDWFFDSHSDLPLLQAFFTEADPLLWKRARVSRDQLAGRGQMGDYWLSLNPLI